MKRTIELESTYPYPPERVWRALTDPAAMGEWLMENDFELRLGHKFQFRAKPQPGWNGIVDCEVTEIDEPRRLGYTWANGSNHLHVAWTLEPVAGGTRLRLEHTGFKGLGGVALSFMLKSGWEKMLAKKFPEVLSRIKDQGFQPVGALPGEDCH